MGQASPYEVIPSQNEVDVFMDTKMFTQGAPPQSYPLHILTIFSTLNTTMAARWHRLPARPTKMRADGTMFGSVGGRVTSASDPSSTPSIGWGCLPSVRLY